MVPDSSEIIGLSLGSSVCKSRERVSSREARKWDETKSREELMPVMHMLDMQVMEINESPVVMLLNTRVDSAQKDLPVTLYETGVNIRHALHADMLGWVSDCVP